MNRSDFRGFVRAGIALGAVLASTALATTAAAAVPGGDAGQGRASAARQGVERGCAVVYFDLGETLVHSAEDGSIGYRPGAAAYLRELRERRIPVGLITNVPSAWGETDAERAAALKKEIDSAWTGSEPFAWGDFGDRILTPRTEEERKPAPVLWERAKAGAGGCRLVYQAETAEEVDVAASLGYVAYLIGQPSRPDYLPARLIELLAHLPR
ncbi:hypothetical protein HUT18_01110 [Streptomyces sp. NA04227]|uniref:hypothetical protein n=1 Tax=Streptomyces sp. NA04227 TaxID=2742136 RepID=UPI0015927282|nr:hypothetical protein [Streptomyces sp. NA04227]QKW05165.1 hypothetical protein HUT18_01110 [Streptomyces sp. NA04227]